MTALTNALDVCLNDVIASTEADADDYLFRLRDAALTAINEAASQLSSEAHHKVMRMAGSDHDCPIEGCRLSVEEHHRLAYGILAENRDLRRRVAAYENGGTLLG